MSHPGFENKLVHNMLKNFEIEMYHWCASLCYELFDVGSICSYSIVSSSLPLDPRNIVT